MQQWNLSSLYKNESDPQIEVDLAKKELEIDNFVNKWSQNDSYLNNPDALLEALVESERIYEDYGIIGKFGYFLMLKRSLNQLDERLKSLENDLDNKAVRLYNKMQFFHLRLAKVSKEKQKIFLSNQKLAVYKHDLEKLFANAKYYLSEDQEQVMNLKSKTSHSNWVNMVSELLDKQERMVLTENGTRESKTLEEMYSMLDSQNKEVRENVAEAINEILSKYVEIAEFEINSILENKKNTDEFRKIPRPDTARHISDDVDSSVVDSLRAAVTKHNNVAQDFYKLKAKLLKIDQLEYYERNLTYGELKNTFTFEEAKNIYLESSKLDESFYTFSKTMFEEGRVDVYPKAGKSGGAFCANYCRISPVYVLLNFTGKLRDVTTLAHEFGHAINFELCKKNSELNYGVSTFVAEVASTFMEDVTGKYLEQSLNEDDRLAYMMDKLNGTISTIFRQIACYEFEMALHTKYKEKSFLSISDIGEMFSQSMKSYTGPAVKFSTGSENWWVYWSHIRSFFYVYSYAGGELIAKALSAKLAKDPTFIKQIKAFYEAGLDKSPKDIFSEMGLDISNENFWEEGIQQIIEDLNSATSLAKKLGKI